MTHMAAILFLLLTDIVGIWAIGSRIAFGSITDRLEGAYFGCGLFLLQIPIVGYGLATARKAKHRAFQLLYLIQLGLTLLICGVANDNWR